MKYLVTLGFVSLAVLSLNAAERGPNIILILGDDLVVKELACYDVWRLAGG